MTWWKVQRTWYVEAGCEGGRHMEDHQGVARRPGQPDPPGRPRRRVGNTESNGDGSQWLSALTEAYIRAGAPTVRQVGAAAGVSHSSAHQMLTGVKVPSWRVASAVLRALGADLSEFQMMWMDATRMVGEMRARGEVAQVRYARQEHASFEEVAAVRRGSPAYQRGWDEAQQAVVVTELQAIRALLERVVAALEVREPGSVGK